jgi:nitrite reductase (NADH) large subunit
VLSDGQKVGYDKLVLCMGADSARPAIPNSDLHGIFTIREYGDADALRRYLQAGARQAVVVGGGLLGLEAAHHLLSPALERLSIVEQAGRLLPRQPDEMGAMLLTRLVERWPCEVLVGRTVIGFLGRDRVEAVRLAGGMELPAQAVLISAGIQPRLELARDAGLKVNRGIVVDARLPSSDPDIYVAGDLVEFERAVWGTIPAALDHAPVVAHNLLGVGGERLYRRTIPQNTLKVAGIQLTSMGKVNLDGERDYDVVQRYDEQLERYEKWVFRDGRLVGCLLLGSRENLAFARHSLGRELDPAIVQSFSWYDPAKA